MKKTFLLLLSLIALTLHAQMVEPVHFSSRLKMLDKGDAEILFEATIDKGWHVYSTQIPDGGPTPATFHAVTMKGAETVGKLTPRGKMIVEDDPIFGMKLSFFEQKVAFAQHIRFTQENYVIDCYLEYGACNEENCLPPTTVELKTKGKSPVVAVPIDGAAAEDVTTEDTAAIDTAATDTAAVADTSMGGDLWTPVIDEIASIDEGETGGDLSWWTIFLEGILGGFLAILTPCVWPIIPMTVSFFLKRNKERGKAIREALTYGASIVAIYVLLGLAVTLLFGASALNALSTNAVFNIFFALLLIVFAASFFGAFELTLPESWTTKMDEKSANTTGILSIFLMAFTLALVSFSCTGPIVGFLLVAVSTQGSIVAPTIGMLGFAIALAIPFTLFAMFPSLLKQAPKSGSWMTVVKVVLGFVELAFALKFLSVADLAYGWHLLDREVFVSIWIVLFALLGCYLLGWLKFSHDDDDRHVGVTRFFLGLVSLAFTIYMVPGLWGAPLKAISAFAPPMQTQDFNLYQGQVEASYTDYEAGMAAAKAKGKPVLVDFTGFGCVNCRKMEAAVWTDPTVEKMLTDDYVLISLYVDDKTPLAEPIEVVESGQHRTLRTVGDKWSYLQRTKVGANTQPCYIGLDNEGHALTGLRSYDEDIQAYVNYLKGGLEKYKH